MNKLLVILLIAVMSGCATNYQRTGMTGGFDEKQITEDVWQIVFSGNGFTNYETVQTYWLWHCAEFTLDKGYAGFEIISKINLSMSVDPQELLNPGAPATVKTHGGGGVIFVPGSSASGPKPALGAQIRLLKGPLTNTPPHKFNAQQLREALLPVVSGKKCDAGNVCPHAHKYLYSDDAAEPSA